MPIANKKYIKRRRKKSAQQHKISKPSRRPIATPRPAKPVAAEMPFAATAVYNPYSQCPPPYPNAPSNYYDTCEDELGI